jgi:hypothetical protein
MISNYWVYKTDTIRSLNQKVITEQKKRVIHPHAFVLICRLKSDQRGILQ